MYASMHHSSRSLEPVANTCGLCTYREFISIQTATASLSSLWVLACFCRRPNSIPVSCHQKLNLDGLLERMWDMMALVSRCTLPGLHAHFCTCSLHSSSGSCGDTAACFSACPSIFVASLCNAAVSPWVGVRCLVPTDYMHICRTLPLPRELLGGHCTRCIHLQLPVRQAMPCNALGCHVHWLWRRKAPL